MHSKTQTMEKAYSREELKRIKEVFAELRMAGKSKDIQEYVKKVKAGLAA